MTNRLILGKKPFNIAAAIENAINNDRPGVQMKSNCHPSPKSRDA
jgi:hypothetical protein